MPRWHLPQVFAMFAWLMGELRSVLRLILCEPWQSLHEGATLPWMLSMYCDAASGNSILYSLVRFVLLWHLAQVAGRFIL